MSWVWWLLYAHRHWSILGAAGHIILIPVNQLIVMGLKIIMVTVQYRVRTRNLSICTHMNERTRLRLRASLVATRLYVCLFTLLWKKMSLTVIIWRRALSSVLLTPPPRGWLRVNMSLTAWRQPTVLPDPRHLHRQQGILGLVFGVVVESQLERQQKI
jgi:hypothetical protein